MPENESATNIEQARRVREMFGNIASRYDLLNHLLSGNIDKRWRREVAKTLAAQLPRGETRILDVACGTGDLSLTLKTGVEAKVVGIDFCHPMLAIAKTKAASQQLSIPFVEGDALRLPFADRSFEAATIGFGLRNLTSLDGGLRELLRVLKPGGTVAVLEFSKPRIPVLRWLFQIYFTKVLPLFGGIISGSRSAYEYLPDSVSRFPDQEQLVERMIQAGFEKVSFRNFSGGIAALHLGVRGN